MYLQTIYCDMSIFIKKKNMHQFIYYNLLHYDYNFFMFCSILLIQMDLLWNFQILYLLMGQNFRRRGSIGN